MSPALSLTLRRRFRAPRERVYALLTENPRRPEEFWGPVGFTFVSREADLRAGGEWRMAMRAPSGQVHRSRGAFRELVRPERVAMTHFWCEEDWSAKGPETLIEITLVEIDGETEMVFVQTGFETESARDAHEGGWNEALDSLAGIAASADGQKITTFLWFDREAEAAMNLYLSLFKNSRVLSLSRYGEGGPVPAGSVMVAEFELDGVRFLALNGGPGRPFTEAISLSVRCEDQAEIDHFWNGLLAGGGEASRCGWLKDPFGLSWQIVPGALGRLMSDPDRAKAGRVMQAMLGMSKFDIAELERAHRGD